MDANDLEVLLSLQAVHQLALVLWCGVHGSPPLAGGYLLGVELGFKLPPGDLLMKFYSGRKFGSLSVGIDIPIRRDYLGI